ncbi:MAG: hypothetical protein IT437_08590 [Phycisphaerales bacterium]|nr:hypothetical protein [Phycisphaerales bacterium]
MIVEAFDGGNVTFTIKGDTTDPIEYIYVTGVHEGYWAKFSIDGASDPYDIPSIDTFGFGAGYAGGKVWITNLKTSGDAGTISANRADDLRILGDVTGDTSVYPIDFSDTLHYMFVGGDVLGDIYSTFIEHLEVAGDIGTTARSSGPPETRWRSITGLRGQPPGTSSITGTGSQPAGRARATSM